MTNILHEAGTLGNRNFFNLVKEPALHWIQNFITDFTTASHSFLYWVT